MTKNKREPSEEYRKNAISPIEFYKKTRNQYYKRTGKIMNGIKLNSPLKKNIQTKNIS